MQARDIALFQNASATYNPFECEYVNNKRLELTINSVEPVSNRTIETTLPGNYTDATTAQQRTSATTAPNTSTIIPLPKEVHPNSGIYSF